MTNLPLAILATLMWMTSNHHWEPEPEREARLWPVAVAIADQTENRREIAFMLTQGFWESRFHRDIGWLQCKPGQCDPLSGTPRAKGYWQNWRIATTPEWAELWDAQTGQATVQESVKLQLAMQRKMACGGHTARAFAAHRGNGCVDSEQGRQRAKMMRQVEARLKKEEMRR